jgi:hypothetical protein
MFYVKYRLHDLLKVVYAGDTLELAEAVAESVTQQGSPVSPGEVTAVEILIDLKTADETARAMAFAPMPRVVGTAGYGTWREPATVADTD